MARRVSRRKEPSREKHMIKEQLKIEEGIFDDRTIQVIGKLFTHGIISKLDFLTAKGKEADVYLADPGEKVDAQLVAVKVFRIETSSFFKRIDYIHGDPRFEKIKTDQYSIVNTWCKKEYGNLKIAAEAKVHAPKPYYFNRNVLAMEFIGSDGTPSPTLRDTRLEDPEKILFMILKDVRRLYQNELVHADLSEYNILIKDNTPYLIDFGQAVVLRHPKATEFLSRDLDNITSYFRKMYGANVTTEDALKVVRGQEKA